MRWRAPFLLSFALVLGTACRGGADLPAAALVATPGDEPTDLAPPPPSVPISPDGPRLYARALETRVFERPDPRARVLGYLRLGQSVPRSTTPVGGASCDGGWYEVLPHGYVCLDAAATLAADDAVLRALGTKPDLSKPMPYLYGFVRRDATLWHMVPDHPLMDKWEYGFQGHLKEYKKHHTEWNRIRAAGANQVPLDEAGNARMLPRDEPPAPPPLDEEHLFPDLGDGSVPWWLAGTRKIPNLSSYVAPDTSFVRGKVSRHAGLAVLGSFRTGKESDHRKFTVLLDGRLIGEDKIKPHLASPFHGIALDGSIPFPFAMVRRRDAQYFDRTGDTLGHPAYGDIIPLNGKILPKDQRFYFETQDRRWVREDQVAVFDTPPPPTAFDWKKTRWIDVSITYQSLVLYDGERPVYATLVSTGVDGAGDPKTTRSTIQGEFRIDYKHVTTTMDADDSDETGSHFELRDVPWVQYFEGGYALHAAYWHDDFGRPRSHGCVNLSPIDARRVFFWTDPPLPEAWHAVKAGRTMGLGTWVRVRR
jgi:L,D-transpeptidase catalytic domain